MCTNLCKMYAIFFANCSKKSSQSWRRWTFSQNFSSLALTVFELEVTCDTWHLISDTWHVTFDTWHMTCVKRHTGGDENFRSLALTVWLWRCLEDSELKDDWINYKAVCKTALATPGLLIILSLRLSQNLGGKRKKKNHPITWNL